MKILITGGGGYLGTVLVRRLLPDHDVTVLDRFSWGTQPLTSVATTGLQVYAGSVADPQAVEQAIRGQDVVVHLAGIVGYPACDANPADADATNVEGTRLVCALAHTFDLPVIFASTGSTYGKVEGEATEDTPVSPLTRYGRNKAEGERLVLAVGGTVLRFATLYGLSPRMRWDLLPNTFARLGVQGELRVYDPEARRTFLHVEDAAEALCMVLDSPLPTGVYNVGDPAQNLSKHAVARAVRRLTGCTLLPMDGHDPDERDYTVNYDKFRAAIGWFAQYPFDLTDVVQFARVWREPQP